MLHLHLMTLAAATGDPVDAATSWATAKVKGIALVIAAIAGLRLALSSRARNAERIAEIAIVVVGVLIAVHPQTLQVFADYLNRKWFGG